MILKSVQCSIRIKAVRSFLRRNRTMGKVIFTPKAVHRAEINGYGQSETGERRRGARIMGYALSEPRTGFPQAKGFGGRRSSGKTGRKP
jgi:hypothetical protein